MAVSQRAREWAEILDHPGLSKTTNQVVYQPQSHQIITTAWQLLSTLAYLEQNHIIHGDISWSNVVSGPSQAQLSQFQQTRLYCGMWTSNFGLSLSRVNQLYQPAYRAPEVWANQHYDCRADVWALACLLYRWAVGVDFMGPFQSSNWVDLNEPHYQADYRLYRNQLLDIDVRLSLVTLPAGLGALLRSMLTVDKITRPLASELLKTALFADRTAVVGNSLKISYPYPLAITQTVAQRSDLVAQLLKQAKAITVLSEPDDVDTVGSATTTRIALVLQSLVLADVIVANGFQLTEHGDLSKLAQLAIYLLTGLADEVTAAKYPIVNYPTLNYYSSGIRAIANNYLRLAQHPAWPGLDISTALQSLLEFTELQGLVILPVDTLN